MNFLPILLSSAEIELKHLSRNRAFVALSMLAAVSFLIMVSLFGLTGSYAPVAIIDKDGGPYARRLVSALRRAHHSFRLEYMDVRAAQTLLHSGRLVGIITIPAGFSSGINSGNTIPLDVQIDNVNVDLTNDVQRALPAAIVDFGLQYKFPGIRAQVVEHDVMAHDTGYIPYLVVSALALDAMLISGILGALATAREFERKTIKLLRLSPASLSAVLAGKLLVAGGTAVVALLLALAVIVAVYGVFPKYFGVTVVTLCACVGIFSCLGALLGTLLRRTLPAVPLLFGLVMPFYIDSGALEPTRFDGESIWRIAHLSPIYYAVGALEWSFHGLRVTPEPIFIDMLVLLAIAIVSLIFTLSKLSKGATA